jgi:hypothetical protein
MANGTFTQYAVIVYAELSDLVNEVTSVLGQGWSLVGGIATMTKGNEVYHYQAIAK